MPETKLAYITKCRLCPKAFNAFGVHVENNQPDQETIDYVLKLNSHLEERHKQQFMECSFAGYELQGLQAMSHFSSADPGFTNLLHTARRRIADRVRAIKVPDQVLQAKASELTAAILRELHNKENGDPQAVALKMLTEMRDLLEERPPFFAENLQQNQAPVIVLAGHE